MFGGKANRQTPGLFSGLVVIASKNTRSHPELGR